MEDSFNKDVTEAGEELARVLNEHNAVESCWFVRGVVDALVGEYDNSASYDVDYGNHYKNGYHSARNR